MFNTIIGIKRGVAVREPKEFWDQWGTLDKFTGRDGGDSCHRIGMYYSLLGMLGTHNMDKYPQYPYSTVTDAITKIRLHHVAPSVFIRHPNLDWSSSNWDNMSRDQFITMVIATGYWDRKQLNEIAIGHLKRGFLFTNNVRRNGTSKANHGEFVAGEVRNYNWKLPDITFFDTWGCFIRAYNCWWLWPLLIIFDLEMLGGSIIWRRKYFKNKAKKGKHNIVMNHAVSLFQAYDRFPTPWSYLARKLMDEKKIAELVADHFDDFNDDMEFFAPMFRRAWTAIHSRKWCVRFKRWFNKPAGFK